MNFKSLSNSAIARAQETASSMQSFREYLESYKNKIIRWSSRTSDDVEYSTELLSLAVHDDSLGEVICTITAEQYSKALDGSVNELELPINDYSDKITVSADTILQAVEDTASEASLQSAFISECIDKMEVSSDEFIQRVRATNMDATADKISQYADLLKSGDPVESLKTLFSTVQLGNQSKRSHPTSGHDYISLSSASDFTGANILAVAWQNLWGTVSSFFDVAWEGILRIGSFIGKLFDGLVNCVKWLVKLVMKPLTTRFEKGNASIGIMDLPLFQLDLCEVRKTNNGFQYDYLTSAIDGMIANWENSTYYTYSMRVHPFDSNGYVVDANKVLKLSEQQNDGRFTVYSALLLAGAVERVDGEPWFRSYDVVVPTSKMDMIVRVGVRDNTINDGKYYLTLQIYTTLAYSSISSLSDGEIYDLIQSSCAKFLAQICSVMPGDHAGNYVTEVTNYWLKYQSDVDNVDLVGTNYVFDRYTVSPSSGLTPTPGGVTDIDGFWCNMLLNGILPYICMFGPSYQLAIDNNNTADPTAPFWNNKNQLLRYFLIGSDYYDGGAGSVDLSYYDTWPDEMNVVDYLPYVQYNLFGVSVHYQSLLEAGNEVLKYIIVVVIAAAAVFLTVKWNQFKKKRVNLAEIRQGYVDNMAWNLPQNPTPEQLQQYQKAKKMARKTNKLNSILGLSSPAKESSSILDSVFGIRDQLLSMQGVSDPESMVQQPTTTLDQIRALLKEF